MEVPPTVGIKGKREKREFDALCTVAILAQGTMS
jgi:hypothetical protein